MSGNTPVVVQAIRTPQGKQGGALAGLRPEELSVPLVDHLLEATGVTAEGVDDLMWGCAQQRDEQDNNLARVIAILSELGESVPATTINRWCASSAQAVMSASDAIRAGQRDCIVVGGVESMTRVPMDEMPDFPPGLLERYENPFDLTMGRTAETVAERYGITREAQDAYAAQSQQRAVKATESGRFKDEILTMETDDGLVEKDEGLRPGTTQEVLSGLPPVFKEDGTVTAGNASQISDGAAALMITSQAFADENGLEPLAEVGYHHVVGVDPLVMGIGPVPAVEGLLERAGTDLDDYDLFELNEAFASQTVYCQRELGIPDDIFNVNGGAIAIGHPLGATGARLPVTLIHEMIKRDAQKGIATECVGFGQGAAIEFELA